MLFNKKTKEQVIVPCETCKHLVRKENAKEVIVEHCHCHNFWRSEGTSKKYFCPEHIPDYDNETHYFGEKPRFWKKVEPWVEVKIKNA